MRLPLVAAATAVALSLAACAHAGADKVDPALYAASVADAARPADEVARDPLRKPAEMLAFAEIKPGETVVDVRPGAGYFTRLFAKVVGPQGKVYAYVPNLTAPRENARADVLVAAYPNVERVNGDLTTFATPKPVDVVFASQEYHDFHLPQFKTDVAAYNRAVFAALKPGGRYVIVDHAGAAGTGNSQVGTLHRIEGAQLRREVEAAGFRFEAESKAVANPADDHTLNVFDPKIRGRTDQFVYRFRKPAR